ncbi:Uncharacterised protein [Bordetella pertussis]|nr:Uncharacterised protein [Bordetella pertussis]CPM77163.1 Uncharacterised protein [Bordetella pertussis]
MADTSIGKVCPISGLTSKALRALAVSRYTMLNRSRVPSDTQPWAYSASSRIGTRATWRTLTLASKGWASESTALPNSYLPYLPRWR